MPKYTSELELRINTKNSKKETEDLYADILNIDSKLKGMGLKGFNKDLVIINAQMKKFQKEQLKSNELLQAQNALRQMYNAYTNDEADKIKKMTSAEKEKYNIGKKSLIEQINLINEKTRASLEAEETEEEKIKQQSLLREEEKKKREKKEEFFDDFRKKGFSKFFTNPFTAGINATNNYFDQNISKNKNKMEQNREEISKIDKDMEKLSPEDSEYQRLANKKANLETQNAYLDKKNVKSSIIQGVFNSMINGIKKFGNIANRVFETMGIDFRSAFNEIIGNIKRSLSSTEGIATYNTSSSIFTNASAREQQMKYGLSSSSNYAFTQAKELLNIRSDEDLMYMNETQKTYFNDLMSTYKGWYDKLESSGALESVQKAQLEFSMFKQEISFKMLNWFAEHKDTIFRILETGMGMLEVIANLIEGIFSLFPNFSSSNNSSYKSSDTSDMALVTNSNSGNTTINVTTNTNATATLSNKEELQSALEESNANLIKKIASAYSGA